jgi:hypothetical protein
MSLPKIIVTSPPNYEEERSYVFKIIFEEFLGLNYEWSLTSSSACNEKKVVITFENFSQKCQLSWQDVLFQTPKENWLSLSSLPKQPLNNWLVSRDLPEIRLTQDSVPVIYGKLLKNGTWFEACKSKINFGLDIAGSIFFMLTRYEELVIHDRDEYGCFPARSSLAFQTNFLERPIVDEYIEILWTSMKRLIPNLERKKHEYKVMLSHDVDAPFGAVNRSMMTVLKNAGGDIIKRMDFKLCTKRILAKVLDDPVRDPYNTFDFILRVSDELGLKNTFFFKSGQSSPKFDVFYDLNNPRIKKLFLEIYKRGHELGFHPSYESYNNREIMKAEYTRFRMFLQDMKIVQSKWGTRQHYLRWENPTTWEILEELGFDYDATLGYADRVGFRCGTCREYPVFNLKERKMLKLREQPLIIMEITLYDKAYMGLVGEEISDKIFELNNICRRFNGMFTLLWHNSNLAQSWQKAMYLKVLSLIA